jgi:hypothetical protein
MHQGKRKKTPLPYVRSPALTRFLYKGVEIADEAIR